MLVGMDTLVAQAFGARDDAACRRTLVQGIWLALGVAPVVALLLALTIPLLRAVGTNPRVMELLGPFVRALLWGVPPLLFYTAFRRYLQAMDIVRPITFAVVSANLLNFAGNWLLMYGNWGAPRLGLDGSGYSTSLSRVYIALVLLIAVLRHERKQRQSHLRVDWRPHWALIRRLLALGFPSADADSGRGRGVRRRDGDGGAVRRGLAGRAQHRRQRDLDHLHGAARDQFGRADDVVVSPNVISGPSLTVPALFGSSANVTPSAPIATAAPAPMPAATSLSCFDLMPCLQSPTRGRNQCCSAVGGMVDGVDFTSDHSIRSLVDSNSSRGIDLQPLRCFG